MQHLERAAGGPELSDANNLLATRVIYAMLSEACLCWTQQEILKGLLGDPSFQLEATRFVLVESLRDFLGGQAFPPPTATGI